MSRWFRHYAGMMRDEKLVSAAIRSKQSIERVLWVYGAILESAAEVNDNGKFALDTAEAAYFLRADQADIDGIVGILEGLGRICDGCVAKWGERQYSSDRSAERTRDYRERKKAEIQSPCIETSRDVDVTSPTRHGDAPETETETELDTEKKEDIRAVAKATRPGVEKDFQVFWGEYPRRDGANPRKPALKAFTTAIKSGHDASAIIAGARRYASDLSAKGQVGSPYVAQAVTWLHQARWEDYSATAEPDKPKSAWRPGLPTDEELREKYAGKTEERIRLEHSPPLAEASLCGGPEDGKLVRGRPGYEGTRSLGGILRSSGLGAGDVRYGGEVDSPVPVAGMADRE